MSNEQDPSKSSRFQSLELIGLAADEIDTYFKMTGRGPVMAGEIALLSNVTIERANDIANTLLQKGLVREIPGKTPYYSALPPYAALLNQIHQFKETIMNIQHTTPQKVETRFKSIQDQSEKLQKFEEYRDFVQKMKTELPSQIKTHFESFNKELEEIKQFRDVKKYIVNLKDIVPADIIKEFDVMETRLEKIKSEISETFEKQFRVPAIKNMAEKIVDRVVSREFNEMTVHFREKFVNTTQNMLDQVINQLGSLSDSAIDIGTDLNSVFLEIESGLRSTLDDLEQRITSVHDDVTSGIANLKEMFQKEIFETISDDIIVNIINQLELSEQTMKEFWERSKEQSLLTYKDVWFVQSEEGMIAEVNNAVSRAKMRLHIIAPRLEDVDIIALSKCRHHINIRICTNFNVGNPEDMERLNQIKAIDNCQLRWYPRENLWSINKDFEEVVVCVVSKTETGQEIAGMGSVLEEHVKLFAALLEDVWIQSKRLEMVGYR